MTNPDLAALSEAATCPWKVGDKVQRKPGSSYDFPGIVISTGLKLNGTTWHCEVEATTPGFEGCTHVFPASGLVPMDPKYERLVHIDEGTRERVARAMCAATGKDPDKLTPAPRGAIGMVPLWTLWATQADAAIAAMMGGAK